MALNSQISVDATDEQKKWLNATAKKYETTISNIVRMMIDYSREEIERRLEAANKALSGAR